MPTFKEVKSYLETVDSLFLIPHDKIRSIVIKYFKLDGV